jgi:hypothetical protein
VQEKRGTGSGVKDDPLGCPEYPEVDRSRLPAF